MSHTLKEESLAYKNPSQYPVLLVFVIHMFSDLSG